MIDRVGISNFLNVQLKTESQKYLESETPVLSKLASSLVSNTREELIKRFPSIEGFKFIVHSTVQVGKLKVIST